jgi:hypothetical protein
MANTNQNLLVSTIMLNQAPSEDFTYIYRGALFPEILDSLLILIERNFTQKERSSQTFKKVYFILVEILQNVTKYQTEQDEYFTNSIVVVQKKNKNYFLTVGNLIKNTETENLTNQINKINSLEKDELTEFYKSVLTNGKYNNKGGAGLGLINIKRKAKHNLNYSFSKINQEHSYFYFTSIIPEKEEEEVDFSFNSVKQTHESFKKDNISLLLNNVLDQDKLKALLHFLEASIEEKLPFRKKIFNILIEMLQNVIYHSSNAENLANEKYGIFLVSETQENYKLLAGNYIHKEKETNLLQKLEKVNKYTLDELENAYVKELNASTSKADSNLGIIDIRMKSSNFLKYNIEKINDQFSFFVLEVNIGKK